MDAIDQVVECAEKLLTLQFVYTNAAGDTSLRIVEPYRLLSIQGQLAIEAWQLVPEIPENSEAWRVFRLDRMTAWKPGRETYVPRLPVTIHTGQIDDWSMSEDTRAMEKYLLELGRVIADGEVSDAEAMRLQTMAESMPRAVVRAAHAIVFAQNILSLAGDQVLNDDEVKALRRGRRWLTKIGYCP